MCYAADFYVVAWDWLADSRRLLQASDVIVLDRSDRSILLTKCTVLFNRLLTARTQSGEFKVLLNSRKTCFLNPRSAAVFI